MAFKNKYSGIDLSKYNKGYTASDNVKRAQKLKENSEKAVTNYGDFKYSNSAALKDTMNSILNREKFNYNINGDALYQQYKDNYINQGKQAMMDTMGQAAAMTGGYGNSYAATVGNQTYQGYLQNLNNIIPELYNLALSSYQTEGDRLLDNYNVLAGDRDTEYGQWYDKYNMLVNDRGYYSDNYNNAYSQDYTQWSDKRDYDQSQYWNEYNAGYQKDRDAVEDAQWQKQFNESVRQFNISSAKSGSGGSGSTETSSIPDYIIEKVETFTDDDSLASYLDDLTTAGAITEAQSDELYAHGKVITQKGAADRTWTVTDDGGWNWFNGVDNNAKLTDNYGNTYTAKDLKKQLMADGMSEQEANEFLKKYKVYE